MIKIYGTLGPRCRSVNTLRAMFDAGMTGVRLNLSHITLHDAAEEIENLHRAAVKCGVTPELLIDLQGPELRIGSLKQPLALADGEFVKLGEGGIPVPDCIFPDLTPGQKILLDDGKLLLEAMVPDGNGFRARVLRGGALQSRKCIALPGRSYNTPTLTEQDRFNLAHAGEYGVTGVMQPFVRNRVDLENVRAALKENGVKNLLVFAKVENQEGLEHLDELIAACDEIVIARGDLGNAMPLWELPRVQKRISAKCRAAGRDFMVVTQMLYTMEHSAVPSRAEVSDIFNAVCDGASSVMVTGETAVGDYPAEAIRYLTNTAREAERYLESIS